MKITRRQLRQLILTEARLLTEEKENILIKFFNTLLLKGIKGIKDLKDTGASALKHLISLENYPKEILKKIKNGTALVKAIIKVLKNMKDAKSGDEISGAIIDAAGKLGIAASSIGIDALVAFFTLAGPAKILVNKLGGVAKKWLANKIEEVTTLAIFKKYGLQALMKVASRIGAGGLLEEEYKVKRTRRKDTVNIKRSQLRKLILKEMI